MKGKSRQFKLKENRNLLKKFSKQKEKYKRRNFGTLGKKEKNGKNKDKYTRLSLSYAFSKLYLEVK